MSRGAVRSAARFLGGVTQAAVVAAAVVAAVVLPAFAAPAVAGYRIVEDDGETAVVSKGRYKNVPGRKDEPLYVFDVNRGRLWMASPATRQYWEGTVDEYCTELPAAIAQATAAMTTQMERQRQSELAKLSPAERAGRERQDAESKKALEALNTPEGQARMKREMEELARKMGADPKAFEAPEKPAAPAAPPKVRVERTAETAKIAGLEARRYRVTVDGEPYEDHWLTTDASLMRELAYDRLNQAMARFEACVRQGQTPAAQEVDVESTKEYRQLGGQGFPLKVVSYESGEPDGQPKEQVASIERQDVPEAEFAPPVGYRKASLAEITVAGMAAVSRAVADEAEEPSK
jgi:Domain of unknown function (DUF4412)